LGALGLESLAERWLHETRHSSEIRHANDFDFFSVGSVEFAYPRLDMVGSLAICHHNDEGAGERLPVLVDLIKLVGQLDRWHPRFLGQNRPW
jgi:hypothetical protein